eukprot:184003-Amphidinium_carterae.2
MSPRTERWTNLALFESSRANRRPSARLNARVKHHRSRKGGALPPPPGTSHRGAGTGPRKKPRLDLRQDESFLS